MAKAPASGLYLVGVHYPANSGTDKIQSGL